MNEIDFLRARGMGRGGAFGSDTSGRPVGAPRPASPDPRALIVKLRTAVRELLEQQRRLMAENAQLRDALEQAQASAQAAWRAGGRQPPPEAAPPPAGEDEVIDAQATVVDGNPWGGEDDDGLGV